ncbi:MAG: GGDEF domain-containing protein [Candidatus Mcinerneyibacterium aminivorans]|uniref:GGDEF domain-containing protein n=1 Tax=Candidatus Mcinerneyibacterium aminivorans TaxID=2703815 RepID=A0A5D0MHA9_9BACT|nr:MAG: GGDEF domain-containing protein [Candidatus Mcinerneyibacterium aminivorans]
MYKWDIFERYQNSFSIIIMDIDDFKEVNDTYGHDCGDYILKQIAALLKKNIRKQDVVARWGGEEFLFLLPDTEIEGAFNLAKKLNRVINERVYKYKNNKIEISITMGISEYNKKIPFYECVIKADKAMYKGKKG